MIPAPPNALDRTLMRRALILFANFMLVILAYYQVKTASRSLLLEYGGPAAFPYVWIGSAVVLLGFIGIYNRLVERFSRLQVVLGSLLGFTVLLVIFRWYLIDGGLYTVVAFYIFVDIFSVVLVEQFWSLTNSITRADEGRRTYWFIASGGLVGGIAGGMLAGALLRYTALRTEDLLLSCGAMLMVTALLNVAMSRQRIFAEVTDDAHVALRGDGLRAVLQNRYLVLIAVVVCISQLAEPIVEFQFLSAIDASYVNKDARTAYIADFFMLMGFISIAVNVIVTPLIHRHLGIIAGLAMQPLLLAGATLGFAYKQSLAMAATMKIADRGLSYSINRASKELLYVPIDPVLTYQAKAWIDMLGYRVFKVLGSGLIVGVTQFVPMPSIARDLSWLTLLLCAVWLLAVFALGLEQSRILVTRRA